MPETKTTTAAAWKKAAIHTITCPSGVEVDIRLPDLPTLIKTGALPNNLLEAAIAAVNGTKKVDKDFVIEQGEFVNKLIVLTVVSPAVTEEDVHDIPVEDKELIAELATRQRDLDALGHHLAGLHTNKDFRIFRGLSTFDEDLEGL